MSAFSNMPTPPLSSLKWQFLPEGSMASHLFAEYPAGSLSQGSSWTLLSIWAQFVDLSGCRILACQCIHPSHAYVIPRVAQSSWWSRHELWTLVRGGRENSFGPGFSLQRGQALLVFSRWAAYIKGTHASVLQTDRFLFLYFFNAFAIRSYIPSPLSS